MHSASWAERLRAMTDDALLQVLDDPARYPGAALEEARAEAAARGLLSKFSDTKFKVIIGESEQSPPLRPPQIKALYLKGDVNDNSLVYVESKGRWLFLSKVFDATCWKNSASAAPLKILNRTPLKTAEPSPPAPRPNAAHAPEARDEAPFSFPLRGQPVARLGHPANAADQEKTRAEQEKARAEEQRRAEEQQRIEEQRRVEEQRRAAEQQRVEERRRAEEERERELAALRKQIEEEARRRREAEEAARLATEAARRAEDEARRRAEEEAQRRREAEEAARLREEEEAKRRRAEARVNAEAEARRRAEEERKRAEQEAARRIEEEARRAAAARRAEEERARELAALRKKVEEEERFRREAEESARLAEQARQRAEEEARKHAKEARLRAREEALLRAREEARQKAEAEERRRLEQERQRAAEEARRRAAEEAKRQAEEAAKRLAEEEAKRRAEEEAKREAARREEARRRAEAEARKRAEEEARRRAEEEARRRAEEEARRLAEEEARKLAAAEAKKRAAEEAKRQAAEEAAKRRAAEEAAKRQAAEEAKRQAAEAKRRAAEDELKRAELEAQRQAAEEARRRAEEAERRAIEARRQAEEAARAGALEESRRRAEAERAEREGPSARERLRAQADVSSREGVLRSARPHRVEAAQAQTDSDPRREVGARADLNAPEQQDEPQEIAIPHVSRFQALRVWAAAGAGSLLLILLTGYVIYQRQGESAPAAPEQPRPQRAEERETQPAPALKSDMVREAGGAFTMGRDDVSPQSPAYNQMPAHTAVVGSFFIDRTEVTNAEYAEFVRATGHPAPRGDAAAWWTPWSGGEPPAGQGLWPVRNVSAADAKAFAAWRSKRDGVVYRLPTEEEWEFAARGGGRSLYPWGDRWEEGRAVVNTALPRPVGSYPAGASPAGAHDLIGNVWEWTTSSASRYQGSGAALAAGDVGKLVTRGGSYQSKAQGDDAVTAASRRFVLPETRHPTLGFRLVRDAP